MSTLTSLHLIFDSLAGKGGERIYGPYFPVEENECKHDREGLLSMDRRDCNDRGSHFVITSGADHSLDSSRVIFGEVVDGLDALQDKTFFAASHRPWYLDGVASGPLYMMVALYPKSFRYSQGSSRKSQGPSGSCPSFDPSSAGKRRKARNLGLNFLIKNLMKVMHCSKSKYTDMNRRMRRTRVQLVTLDSTKALEVQVGKPAGVEGQNAQEFSH
ncbi:uncharacterized protein LOC129319673 [Prosopis cineraria]|uniref:uncharacterized protein LOC129319673 n=1 Tax=Prosopis cineraria TaxID=364024 RepID=UPI00240F6301|nr:uncharacterized protein LOC129319673 [Prosopis cineraria]